MITLETLTTFFGWCTVINFIVLSLAALIILLFKAPVMRIHNRVFGVDEQSLPRIYVEFLGNYKMAFYIFNFVPYISLKIMA